MRGTDIAANDEIVATVVGRGRIHAHLWDSSHFLTANQSDVGPKNIYQFRLLGVASRMKLWAERGGAFLDARQIA